MLGLMESVKHVVEKKVLTNENVMDVAAVAENFLIIFEDISKELQQLCGNFLSKNLSTFTEVQEFLQKSDDDFDLNLFKKLVVEAEPVSLAQFATAQKASSWECAACLVRNDVAKLKQAAKPAAPVMTIGA